MTNKWIILAGGWEPHIVINNTGWKEALLSHAEWCGYMNEKTANTYKTAFEGFTDMKEAIDLFNIMHPRDRIDYMSLIKSDDYYNFGGAYETD